MPWKRGVVVIADLSRQQEFIFPDMIEVRNPTMSVYTFSCVLLRCWWHLFLLHFLFFHEGAPSQVIKYRHVPSYLESEGADVNENLLLLPTNEYKFLQM